MPNDELCFTRAVDLAAAIRARKLSPVEVTTAVLARIDKINPVVNAYCTVVADRALDEARRAEAAVAKGERLGPLHGVPISFKDLTPTAGIRTTFGSKAFEHNVQDAALLMTVWAGPDERDPQSLPATGEDFGRAIDTGVKGLRAALSLDLGFAAVDQEVRRIVAAAAKSLTGLGVSVDEAHPGFDGGVEAVFMDLTAPIRAAALAPPPRNLRAQ